MKRRFYFMLLVLALILLALPRFVAAAARRVTRPLSPRPASA
jgi:HAMP domain-containing protein